MTKITYGKGDQSAAGGWNNSNFHKKNYIGSLEENMKPFIFLQVNCHVKSIPSNASYQEPNTAWKVSKYGVFSGPYFPVFNPKKWEWEI